jgi:hypothetical protein
MARYNFLKNLGESREPEAREAVERSEPWTNSLKGWCG